MKNVRSFGYYALISIAVWIALAASGLAQGNATSKESVTPKLDEYMTAMTSSGLFMGSVLVAQDGKMLLSNGYGMANLEYDIPNNPHTRFDIGSVSKTFTATLVLMLQQ